MLGFDNLICQLSLLYNLGMKRNETIQNYLEAVYIISLQKDTVRAIDIVNYLKFSRPTVSVALKQLEAEEYINIDANKISLTQKGIEVAKIMYERHEFIAQMLIKLGVSEKQAYEDSCLVEHDLSEESFVAIKNAAEKIK